MSTEYLIYDEETGCYVEIWRNVIPPDLCQRLITEFEQTCNVQYPMRRIHRQEGQSEFILQPRCNCFYSDEEVEAMTYSLGAEVPRILWTPNVLELRNLITIDPSKDDPRFFYPDSCLINSYIEKKHHVGLHSDKYMQDENNTVCTVSLGGTRIFRYVLNDKNHSDVDLPKKVETYLHSGDVVYFYGNTNEFYKHDSYSSAQVEF